LLLLLLSSLQDPHPPEHGEDPAGPKARLQGGAEREDGGQGALRYIDMSACGGSPVYRHIYINIYTYLEMYIYLYINTDTYICIYKYIIVIK